MSLGYFQLLDNELFDNSILKREFLIVYHQQGAQINQSDQNIALYLVKTINIIK